jgi:hypothetical protein
MTNKSIQNIMINRPYNYKLSISSDLIADLFSKAHNMDIFEIKNFVLINKIPLSVQDNDGNNLIHIAIDSSSSKTEIHRLNFIKSLYHENVNPDAPNKNNVTPLLLACKKQYIKIIEYLIEIGVDINYYDNFKNNAYNYLFSSMIKNYKKKEKKPLFAITKKIDDRKLELLNEHKITLYNELKNSPFLNSLIDTIRREIANDDIVKEIASRFNQALIERVINTGRYDDFTLIQEIYYPHLNEFITAAKNIFGNFQRIENVTFHKPDRFSFPQNDRSGLAIIKDADYKEYLKEKIQENIDLLQNTIKENKIINLVDLDYMYEEMIKNINNENDYQEMNKYIHHFCIDNADNIIDYKNNTFAGGSRYVTIIDEITNDQSKYLINHDNNNDKQLIAKLLSTLILNNNDSFAKNYPEDFDGGFNNHINLDHLLYGLKDIIYLILTYIYKLSTNSDIMGNIETELLSLLKRRSILDIRLYNLINIIDKRNKYNFGHFIYILIINIIQYTHLKIDGNVNTLEIELNQGIVLLCSGLYHYHNPKNKSTSLAKSIMNVIKPLRIRHLNKIPLSYFYGEWINLLFKNDTITGLTTKYFKPEEFSDDDKNEVRFVERDLLNKLSDCEILCIEIINYYEEMNDKPLLQNVVDTLILIRLFELNKSRNPQLIEDIFINKLKGLYLSPDFSNVSMFTEINGIEPDYIEDYFKTLFNNIDDQELYEIITQYEIPSRINYFLYGGLKYLKNINLGGDIEPDQELFKAKQIEANHFGLNFIGILPEINVDEATSVFQPNANNDRLLLFNYAFINNIQISENLLYLNRNMNNFRPPTYMSYLNLLERFKNNLNRLQNNIFIKLRKIFNNIKSNPQLYSKAIGYYYPILNAIESHETFFEKLIDEDKDKYNLFNKNDFKDYYINNDFNINIFNSHLNKINGLLFLYYYLDTDNIIEIPKFIYHQLGDGNPLTIFHDPAKDIELPNTKTNQDQTLSDTDTSDIDNRVGSESFIGNIDYQNIITKIKERRFFINRKILNESFVTSKNSKLPPSFKSITKEFIDYNIIEIIKKNHNISINDEIIDIIPGVDKKYNDINKSYTNAILIQDIIKNELRESIRFIGYEMFNNIVKIHELSDFKPDYNIFGSSEFNVKLEDVPKLNNQTASYNEVEFLRNFYYFYNEVEFLRNFYYFSEDLPKEDKPFLLYPNNYDNNNFTSDTKLLYQINVNDKILKQLIESGCNLFNINNMGENIINNLIKYKNYGLIKKVKENGVDIKNIFETLNLSPLKYIIDEYKDHINKFCFSSGDYSEQLKLFTQSLTFDVKNNIMGNEKLGFNVMKNILISFQVCNYITQQYLTEYQYNFSDNYKLKELYEIHNKILDNKSYSDFKNLHYNEIVQELYSNDIAIIVEDMLGKKQSKLEKLNKKLNNINIQITNLAGLINTTKLVNMKDNIEKEINNIEDDISELKKIVIFKSNKIQMNDINMNIIKRYESIVIGLNDQRIIYMNGFSKLLKNDILKKSNENITQHLLNYENENKDKIIDNKNNIETLYKYYEHLNICCEDYFNEGEFIVNNKSLEFVRDLLVHLTKNVICVGIDTLIRRVLFEYLKTFGMTPEDINININMIIIKFKPYLYDKLSTLFVINNTSVFMDENEKAGYEKQSVNDLLEQAIELLESTSIRTINDITKNRLREIIPYFETIIPKLINNWRAVIENQFLFIINHSRILKIINELLN